MWRGDRSSWGGCECGPSSTCIAGEANGFEVGHLGGRVRGGARDGSFEESDSVGWERRLAFVETAIRLKTDRTVVRCVASGQNPDGNIGSLWQSGDGVWK